jgi:hypothetical protein
MFWSISTHTVVPKKFLTLPLGQVMPNGWIRDQVSYRLSVHIQRDNIFTQLNVQTNGLAGHLHDFYN